MHEDEHSLRGEQCTTGAAVQGRGHLLLQEEQLREQPGMGGEREEEGICVAREVCGGGWTCSIMLNLSVPMFEPMPIGAFFFRIMCRVAV